MYLCLNVYTAATDIFISGRLMNILNTTKMLTHNRSFEGKLNKVDIKCILERKEYRSSLKRNKLTGFVDNGIISILVVC